MVEAAKTFQQLAFEFDAIIQNRGSIKAELLDNGRVTSTEITYLPDDTVVFEKHAPHRGFPPYFSVGPDGVFLDRQKTKPAEDELNLLLVVFRTSDPRFLIQLLTAEEQDQFGGRIDYDLQKFTSWPKGFKEIFVRPISGEAFYTRDNSRLYQITTHDNAEALTIRFIYPEAIPDQPVTPKADY